MAKYSFEFKKKEVMSYLNGEGGFVHLSHVYDIPSDVTVKLWVDNYNKLGDKGLMRSRENDNYTFTFCSRVVFIK